MDNFLEIFGIIGSIIIFLIIISFIVLEIIVWVMYGNLPINEIPVWALLFMFGGK